MQKPQPGEENFVESSRSVLYNVDQEFVDSKQTAEISAGTDMEFVQTHYSPRGVLLLYFRGDAAAEVDKHFDRTFSELCCLPGSSASDNSMESSHWQGAYTLYQFGNVITLFSRKKLSHVDHYNKLGHVWSSKINLIKYLMIFIMNRTGSCLCDKLNQFVYF